MLQILLVFLASFIVIAAVSYILYSYYQEQTTEGHTESFGVPTRTQTMLDTQSNCDIPEMDENEQEDDDVISMEDILQMRNGKGETVHQKALQKMSGMGYREGPPGPSEESSGQVSKPENQLQMDTKDGVVWSKDTAKPSLPPSHLMGDSDDTTSGGILPGLDREGGSYSSL